MGLGTLEHFLGLAHRHVTAHAPMQTYLYANKILSLQNQESVPMSPDPFLACVVGSGNETTMDVIFLAIVNVDLCGYL